MTMPETDRSGFSLVEVIVALIILTVGVLGMAATTMLVVRQTTLSEMTTERSAALQTVIERLRSEDYETLSSGADTVGRFDVNWSVTTGVRTKQVEIVTVGPGLTSASGVPTLASAVADTFEYRVMER
jgi:type IV pilus modification protein PilV